MTAGNERLGPRFDDGDDEQEEKSEETRVTPTALTQNARDLLFKSRTLIISGEINQRLAANVIGQLLAMDSTGPEPITIYINSQGGHVESGDTIHDMIRYIRSPVRMVGTGWVASAGALIYVAVPAERRYSLPHTRYLLHQPAGGMRGSASDVEIEAREMVKMRERLNNIFAERTGQKIERIEEDTRRNFWLGAEDAVKYGLVGKIIDSAAELK